MGLDGGSPGLLLAFFETLLWTGQAAQLAPGRPVNPRSPHTHQVDGRFVDAKTGYLDCVEPLNEPSFLGGILGSGSTRRWRQAALRRCAPYAEVLFNESVTRAGLSEK